jgi:hypothetical protein
MAGIKKRVSISLVLFPLMLTNGYCISHQYDDEASLNPQPYRIALKAGSPNLVGLEFEALVPGARNWLGVWVDGSYLPIGKGSETMNGEEIEKEKGGLNHIGIGSNFYFTGKGSGFLASVGYDRVSAYTDIVKTETGKKSWVNPTHLLSTQLAYKYIGTHLTYSFFGGYGFNFAYTRPVMNEDDKPLFNKGNWVLAGISFGIALPFQRAD